ncbi:MAG: DUF2703 domain-containing protein [Candidatus Thermoplasmatota archaeon]
MKHITIEWKHLDEDGETCLRCSKSRDNLISVINSLREDLKKKNILIDFREVRLTRPQIKESNMILIDSVPIEDILDAKDTMNHCISCCDLIGEKVECRAILYKNRLYEDITESMIKEAVKKVVSIK